MPSNITAGTTGVAGLWTTYILRRFVPGLKAELLFADYAEPATLPRGAGGYVARWNVPQMRDGSTTAITEGTTGGNLTNAITINNVEATITTKGEHVEIGDIAAATQVAGGMNVYREIITYAGASAIDSEIRDEVLTGTGQGGSAAGHLHAGDTTTAGLTLATGDQLTAQDFPVIAGYFHVQNAKGWDRLSGDYMLAIEPNVEINLITDVTTAALSWSEVNKHVPAGFEQLVNNKRFVGRLASVTALRTTKISTVTEDVAAYANIALARYGVGWLGLGSSGPKAPQVIMKVPGPQSTNDPLNMMNTLGWKVRSVARLLDENRALVVYSATA